MWRFFIFLVVGGAVGFALMATDALSFGDAPERESAGEVGIQPGGEPAVPVLTPAPAGMSITKCIDPTASTDEGFAKSILASLVQVVRGYVPPQPTDTRGGIAGVPGLEVTVRLVSTRPLAYGEPYAYVEIPPVDGLPPRPDMTQPGALDPGGQYLAWKKLEAQWAAQYRAALAAQSDAVETLERIDLSYAQRSGVRDCVAALMTVPSKYPDLTIVVASDLGDNEFTGSTPKFDGTPMLVIQPCPSGDASKCASRQKAFEAWTGAHGAGPVSFARPEAADGALTQLVSPDH